MGACDLALHGPILAGPRRLGTAAQESPPQAHRSGDFKACKGCRYADERVIFTWDKLQHKGIRCMARRHSPEGRAAQGGDGGQQLLQRRDRLRPPPGVRHATRQLARLHALQQRARAPLRHHGADL